MRSSPADIAFFTANQLALLPSASVDAFVNISSLHEMAAPQIDHYVQQMARTTRHAIYLKQWREFTNLADNVRITRASYRLPDAWRIVHDAPDTVQDRFFELVASGATLSAPLSARSARRDRLHQLGSGAVGVEQVELPAAVAADARRADVLDRAAGHARARPRSAVCMSGDE